MELQLYFAPGACSFVPHVGLEAAKAEFEPKLVKLHRGEQRTPEYLALNPSGQVPVLLVDGRPLTQIVAICDFLDRSFPQARLLPQDGWERSQALSQLAWMNSTPHITATRFFFPERYAESEPARAEVKKRAAEEFRRYLERLQDMSPQAAPYWFGERVSFHDAYAFTLLRWGGFAAALARERIGLDTYKG
jgi:glutathione S-transferase